MFPEENFPDLSEKYPFVKMIPEERIIGNEIGQLFCVVPRSGDDPVEIIFFDEFLLPVFTSGSYPRYKGSMSFRICHRHKGKRIFQVYCLSDLFCRIDGPIPERSIPAGRGHCLIPDFHDPRLSIC